jgi:hypothetical protein
MNDGDLERVKAFIRRIARSGLKTVMLPSEDSQWWVETIDIKDVKVGDRLEETIWDVGSAFPMTGTVIRRDVSEGNVVLLVSLDHPVARLSGTLREIEVRRPPEQWVKRLRRR